jgi:type I restriction enzyme S subunit
MNQEGTGQKVVNTSAWQEFIVPYPPKKEQEIIVKHIAAETHRLDSLESEVERSVQLLKEHRTALISAAVTGKIDVRGMVDTKEGAA